jgi:hypothetical protein
MPRPKATAEGGKMVEVQELTGPQWVRQACSFTINAPSLVCIDDLLKAEHSPIRCLTYFVRMYSIPSFVSVHLVRHNIGVEHFVQSMRDDRGGSNEETRWTPINHAMFINAQALINMARKRLCAKSHKETRRVMRAIKEECPDYLKPYLVPECTYRNGLCPEARPCQ